MSNHFLLALSVFVYLLFVFSLFFRMFRKRTQAVKEKKVDYRYYKTYSSDYQKEPQDVAVFANHINNQFQLPPIFISTVVLMLSFSQVSIIMVVSAWIFVLLRFLHSYIHLGTNNILHRAKVYALGWVVLFAMWVQILLNYL